MPMPDLVLWPLYGRVFEEGKECPFFKVDLATVMAEMFKIGDRNKDDVLTR